MPIRSAALALSVVVVWGVNFVVIDEGLRGIPPVLFAAVRFVLVAIPAVFLVPRPQASWQAVTAVGLTMSAGQFAFLYLALKVGMPPGLASLVLQSQVVVTVALAALLLREHVGRRQVVGLTVGVAGLVVVGLGRSASTPVLGVALTVVAATSWALGNIRTRTLGLRSGLPLVVWSALVVPLPLLLVSLVVEGPASWVDAWHAWGWRQSASTAYTVVLSTLFGYGVWNSLLARHPASRVVPFALLVPVFGIAAAWLVQGTYPGPLELLGGLVLLAGAALTLWSPSPSPRAAAEVAEP
ncbi:MAG: EamA family transporter [Nocardioidaceae bacterium]